MPNLLRMTGWVLGCFLAFDLVGVGLTLLVDMVVVLHRVWEGSSFLAYVIWFVVGVFCAMFIYFRSTDDGYDSPAGRRRGLQLLVITSVVAVVLGMLSSFVWSDSGAGEAVAPDHRGVTITYLVAVVLVVAWARFVLFRERPPESERFQPDVERFNVEARPEQERNDPGAFEPRRFWTTVGFVIGVPLLLFLDASFFLLGPFDYFDRWTDPILTTALGGGLAWGVASARWKSPRVWLLVVHAPLLIGTVCYFFAVLLGGLLIAVGVPERVSEIVSYVGFGIGFLLGCGAVVGKLAEIVDRAGSGRMVRP